MKTWSLILFSFFLFACQQQGNVGVDKLSCELLVDPQGIDCQNPRLGWQINPAERGVEQNAYRILVSTTLEKLNANEGDLWDSGKTKSKESIFVSYGGKPLESRMECYWKVQVFTNKGASGWSQPARWMTGLTKESDWKARWIGLDKSFKEDVLEGKTRLAARYFRKEFEASGKPVKATVYVSGLGLYKLYVNGQKIGDQELSPTPTDYSKSVKYNTFDLTDVLSEGKNALATALGNGRFFSMQMGWVRHFGFPQMILQLEIEYGDGTVQTIVSDDSWRVVFS